MKLKLTYMFLIITGVVIGDLLVRAASAASVATCIECWNVPGAVSAKSINNG